MIGRIAAIAAAEFRIAIRNRWLLTATLTMTGFALLLALAGSAPAGTLKVDALTLTVSSLATLSVYLVPLIALILSYDSFAGEAERGTLALLLTYPVRRSEIVAAKFIAALAVLAISVIAGFGLTASILWGVGGASSGGMWLLARLIASAILLGGAFIGIGSAISACTRSPGTAASIAIGVWLVFVVMYDIALLGAVVADDGGVFTRTIFPWLLIASPTDAFRIFNLSALDPLAVETGLGGIGEGFGLPAGLVLTSLLTWPVLAVSLAGWLFRRVVP